MHIGDGDILTTVAAIGQVLIMDIGQVTTMDIGMVFTVILIARVTVIFPDILTILITVTILHIMHLAEKEEEVAEPAEEIFRLQIQEEKQLPFHVAVIATVRVPTCQPEEPERQKKAGLHQEILLMPTGRFPEMPE